MNADRPPTAAPVEGRPDDGLASVSAPPSPGAQVRLGIDLGGTKIEVAALDAQGRFLLRERCPTPRDGYEQVLDAIAGLIALAEQRLALNPGVLPVGIGIPGSPSPTTGRIRNANSTVLNGRPLVQDLRARLGRPVRVENDANCLALSEATDGAGAGADVVFAVILGTGVGGGIAVRGQVLGGCNGIAGEWGHNPLPQPRADEIEGPPCWCGRRGCIESWLSGPGLAADHARHGGETFDAAALAARAAQGDAAARASLDRWFDRLGRALALVINVLDPQVVVLGGGLSLLDGLADELPRRWAPHVFSDSVRTAVRPARHGDSSGVRGAAWLSREAR